jgi:hypothetical protein
LKETSIMADDRRRDYKPRFDPEHWTKYSNAMKSHLLAKGLWGAIVPQQDPNWPNLNHQQHLDKRVQAYDQILKSLSPNYSAIANLFQNNHPEALWDHLEDEY